MSCYVIWEFAENKEGAKKFLVDLVDNFSNAFNASEFYNFPCFPGTVKNLHQLIADDPKAVPHDKYKVLGSVLDWATNIGFPGYATAAIDATTTGQSFTTRVFQFTATAGDHTLTFEVSPDSTGDNTAFFDAVAIQVPEPRTDVLLLSFASLVPLARVLKRRAQER